MNILYVNNAGAGFADEVDVKAKTTIGEFFKTQMKGCKPEDSLIRVNREIVTADYVLQEGDRVTITPTHIEGATRK
ncbi:MAG: molybdopterin converting factor [Dehalococcoidia bacterium]|nr:molybdopterin converting factor [Dehalococcoidia bacterium]